MSPRRTGYLLALLGLMVLAGCANLQVPGGSAAAPAVAPPPAPAIPPRPVATAKLALQQGEQRYQEGSYEVAALWLDEALAVGLEPRALAVRAHKLRAFIDCITGRSEGCREHFRAALRIDPNFDLARAEAGHPMWGPVFQEVKESLARPASH